MNHPKRVRLVEVGPRDGLQNEKRTFSIDEKLHFIHGLETHGVRRIQVGSFVHPKWVPQMADTDELFAHLKAVPGVVHTALVLNLKGVERAVAAGVRHLSMSISASETHSLRNNNRTTEESKRHIIPMIEMDLSNGIDMRAGIQTALGCGFGGEVPIERTCAIAATYSALGVQEINIADTAGLGNPRSVFETVSLVRDVIDSHTAISLHLHDTRGLGLANMLAGLQAGVRIFDTALGGVGGCPFIPAAAGNIATEDAAYTMAALGIETGIDWQGLCGLALELEGLLERTLPSRMAHIPRAA